MNSPILKITTTKRADTEQSCEIGQHFSPRLKVRPSSFEGCEGVDSLVILLRDSINWNNL